MNHSDDFEPNLFLGPLRTILLLLLVQAVGGFFVLEQPSSSLLTRHDRFRWLVRHWQQFGMKVSYLISMWLPKISLYNADNLGYVGTLKTKIPPANLYWFAAQVFYQDFWMKAWGHVTAKRTYVLSNSHLIKSLDSGAMKRKELYSEVSTTDRYESQDGRKSFKGNANLKGTQFLSLQFYFFSLVSQMSIYSIDTSRLRARVKKMIPAFWIFPSWQVISLALHRKAPWDVHREARGDQPHASGAAASGVCTLCVSGPCCDWKNNLAVAPTLNSSIVQKNHILKDCVKQSGWLSVLQQKTWSIIES